MAEKNLPTPGSTAAVLVIFGITGDLSRRKLLPALYHLFKEGLLHEHTRILGVSRRDVTADDLMQSTELCVLEDNNTCDPAALKRMHNALTMYQMDMDDGNAFDKLKQYLDDQEGTDSLCRDRLYYLSVPPNSYANLVTMLGRHGLQNSCPHGSAHSRLLIEKPFGHDTASAEKLIDTLTNNFTEEQIFRIDHFMAKETAQNILSFRFNNPLFAALWNKQHITRIGVEASETLGIEGRANFYEGLGALRDVIQSHLLQLLALVAMEPPESGATEDIHAARLALLKAVKPVQDPANEANRAQYDGYRQEAANEASTTETFASLRLEIDNERWRGVPVMVRTGKNLADKRTAVAITFDSDDTMPPNHFRFYLQPTEGISIGVQVKQPGYADNLETAEMEFSYKRSFNAEPGHPDAYERVLIDAIRGDRTLFTSSDEVMAAWNIVQPVLDAWQDNADGLRAYAPGSDINDVDSLKHDH